MRNVDFPILVVIMKAAEGQHPSAATNSVRSTGLIRIIREALCRSYRGMVNSYRKGINMPVQMLTYDLRRPGQNYPKLIAAIQALGDSRHCLDSVWLVATNLTSVELRNQLQPHLDGNDSLLVMAVEPNQWGSLNLNKQVTDWLATFATRR